MEKPMDRLLCGDVGYGKTEVALRAAFKAVMDQKQVAYLAPTTVLAEQQYQEFKERVKDFPIQVEILNRFKSKKYQDEVVKKLKLGEVDIVIGTHRVLSKDVQFKDLGLLIIDEEHRFGVKDKEKMAIEIINEIVPNAQDWEIMKELSLLQAESEILYRKFSLLSGGEQVKILLISLFLKENHFLLIDEPTNHLDYETRNHLAQYLEKKKVLS